MVRDNEQMPNTEKMLRLRQCLKGEAARVIQHLQISQKNYEAAWSLLKKKYDNQRILFIIPKLSTTATKLTNAVQKIEDEKLITVRLLPLYSVKEKTTEIIEEDKKENEIEEEFFAELHEPSKTEESLNLISLPAGSHFGEMWESEVQTKSIEYKDEADHIVEDDAKAHEKEEEIKILHKQTLPKVARETIQKEDNEIVQIEETDSVKTLGLQLEPKRDLFKFKAAPQQMEKSTKTVAALKDTRTSKDGSSSSKDERKCSKSDDDKSKKKDEKSGDKMDEDISKQKSSSNKISQKDDKKKSSVNTSTKSSSTGKQTTPSRNLWVSGLPSLTRASDLKTIFSKYGKVIGAKVVTNTRTLGTRCYGYVTMSSSPDASHCFEHLHHTEISVERTKDEIGSSTSVAKTRADITKKDEDKKIRDTTSKTRDDKRKTIDTKKDQML
ncbi:SAFB-like transcription modulator [Bactrocera tryoni]|uniref:SAFB-like transcription modulator n=1 Tax=Bactrocera tryoni TaxID=59916 RepID=UPI001A960162|nr:SAFB-like transcription modulator [Bactrocera tryoni]